MNTRTAQRFEYPAMLRMLQRAFGSDPAFRWLLPDDADWQRFGAWTLEWYMSPVVGSDCIVVTEDLAAAAIWHPPGPVHRGAFVELIEAYRWCRMAGRRLPEFHRYGTRIAEAHPKERHWYLAVLGTEPERQGRGMGSALLRQGLARCDAEGIPAYLETTRESNVALYRRFGFELTGELRTPPYPNTWFMLRPVGAVA